MFIYQGQPFCEIGISHMVLAPSIDHPLVFAAVGTSQGHQTVLSVYVPSKQFNLISSLSFLLINLGNLRYLELGSALLFVRMQMKPC